MKIFIQSKPTTGVFKDYYSGIRRYSFWRIGIMFIVKSKTKDKNMKLNWRKLEIYLGGGSIVAAFVVALLSIWMPGFPAMRTFGTLFVVFLFAKLLKASNDKEDENLPD